MATTRDEGATTEANTVEPSKNDRKIADIVALCGWNFAQAVLYLSTCEERVYYSILQSYNDDFKSWEILLCVYDEGYEGLNQRLKRQPDFRLSFEWVLDMLNEMLHSITFDYVNATSPEAKVQNIWPRLRLISRSVRVLHELNHDIRVDARPTVQYFAETYLKGSMTKTMFHERFKNKAAMALLGLYPAIFWPIFRHLRDSMGSQYTRFLYWKTHASPMQQSSICSPNAEPQQNKQSIEGSTPTFVQFDKSVARFPKPPHFKGEEDKKRCPICFKVFSKSSFENVSWWRRHVNQDILPFVCMSPECSDSPCYATRSEWAAHMNVAHGDLLLEMELASNGGNAAPDRHQPLKTCLICAPRETNDSSNDCNDPQTAAATEHLHVNLLANDHELKHLHYGAMLSHIADHLQAIGLLALKMSRTALSAKEKKKMVDPATSKSYDDDPEVLGQNAPEDILADVLSHQDESIRESMANGTRAQSIDGETGLEHKATLWQNFGDKAMLLDKVQQIRLTYDNLLKSAWDIHARGNLDLPPKASAALVRMKGQVPRRIGEPDAFTREDLYDFFDGLFSTMHCGENNTIVDYCTDQVWAAHRYRDKRRPTGESFASRRRLFSMLMIHESPEAILGFIREGITDFHIPISEDTLKQKFPTWTNRFIASFLMIQSQYLFIVPCAENILKPDQYTIAWICDTPTLYLAARTFLEQEHSLPERISQYDGGVVFSLGTIAGNKIVIAAPLYRKCGTMNAAAVVQSVLQKFPSIKASLIVGLGGGMPSRWDDIRLGDVVVGATQRGKSTYSVFYQLGEPTFKGKFQKFTIRNQLPGLLQKAVRSLNPTTDEVYSIPLFDGVDEPKQSTGEIFQGTIKRRLQYFPGFLRKYERPNSRIDKAFFPRLNKYLLPRVLPRLERPCEADELIEDPPRIHYGRIASSDEHMKDCEIRHVLESAGDILCFDSEAAGFLDHPCLVIRGICQYWNSGSEPESTRKIWQDYSAITAATYANEILKALPPIDIGAGAEIGDTTVPPG